MLTNLKAVSICLIFVSHSVHAFGEVEYLPRRSIGYHALHELVATRTAVIRKSDGFYLDSGRIFYVEAGKGPRFVKDSLDVVRLSLVNDRLYAIQSKGQTYRFDEVQPGSGQWVRVDRQEIASLAEVNPQFKEAIRSVRPDLAAMKTIAGVVRKIQSHEDDSFTIWVNDQQVRLVLDVCKGPTHLESGRRIPLRYRQTLTCSHSLLQFELLNSSLQTGQPVQVSVDGLEQVLSVGIGM